MAKKIPEGAVRIQNKQAWVDTITYLCPKRTWNGSCSDGTNCTGHGTATGSCACSYVTEYLHTYIRFVRGELQI